MINRIKRRHIRQQRLRGADVTGSFFATDMLFARLECEPQGGLATGVFGNTDDASRNEPLKFIARGKESRVRSAIAQRYAETLRATDSDVRTKLARGLDKRKRK